MQQFRRNESNATLRRFYLHLVDATDGITPETGEAGGQPQISKNGGAFGNTAATLTAVSNGLYYVVLTAAELNTAGVIAIRYKSAETAEFQALGGVNLIPNLVWDEILTGATHNIQNSAGRHLRLAGGGTSGVAFSGTLQAGSTTTVTLPVGASAQDDAYKGWTFLATGGAGMLQTARLVSYNGTTKVGVLDRVVPEPFDNTTTFDMYTGSTSVAVEEGVAQAGDGTSITARAGASAEDDAYNNWQAVLTDGTPDYGVITDYDGTTKVATVSWAGAGAAADQGYAFIPPVSTAQDSGGGVSSPTLEEISNAVQVLTDAIYSRLGAPTGASVSADIATLLGADSAYKKNVAVTGFMFAMRLPSGAVGTGLTVTGTISKDGGAFSALGASVAEVSGGWYKVNLAQAEMNADEVALNFTAPGAQVTQIKIRTQA